MLDVALTIFSVAVSTMIRHPSSPNLNLSKFRRWTMESRCQKSLFYGVKPQN